MNFNHLLVSAIPQKEKMLGYGFEQKEDFLFLKKPLNEEFYAEVVYSEKGLGAEVFERESGEKYFLVDVKSATGAFVNGIRAELAELMEEIAGACFEGEDVKARYVDFLEKELGVKGDYPWEKDSDAAVFRCKNGKWFALVMKIRFKNLGFESDEPVWVVNLKADWEKISALVDRKSIFPAWHMNKKYWITVVLTAVTDFEVLKSLTLRSQELVEKA
ncbi:MAG: MmcQ/YjbR family DNA-binding protein [Treponema sp.]|nr:MmcQ/YjbR family DNA-binding protein [Treponema sp.]